jgi:hypothetical protein
MALADIFPGTGDPEDLLQREFKAAYYPGPSVLAQAVREEYWHLQREGKLGWRFRTYENTGHVNGSLQEWGPEIVILHWHGERPNGPKYDIPTQIAQRLRSGRGTALGDGPFLVGQFSRQDVRFDPHDTSNLIDDLLCTYDMLCCQASLERMCKNVTIGLWNCCALEGGGKPRPLDANDEAYQSCLR